METVLFHITTALLCGIFSIVSFTVMLLYPIKRKQKFLIFLYTFSIIYMQNLTTIKFSLSSIIFLVLSGTLLLILLPPGRKIINLLCVILNLCVAIGVSYLLIIIASHFFIDDEFFKEYPYMFCLYFIIQIIFTYFISYYLYKILYYFYCKNQITDIKISYKKKMLFLLLWESGICCLILLFQAVYGSHIGFSTDIMKYNTFMFLLLFASTSIVTLLFLRSSLKEHQLTEQLAQAKAIKDYTDKIESLYLDIRTFKHDYINILSSLHCYIAEQNYKGLEAYFYKEILPTGTEIAHEDSIYGRLGYIQNPSIKSIIYTKIFSALNENIYVTTDIKNEIIYFPMNTVDLVRILGILLDNALEACMISDKKFLSITFYKDTKGIYILISNSSPKIDDNIIINNISSKGKNRGIGLYEVRRILNQYPNALLSTEYKNFVFTQKLTLLFTINPD